MLQSMRHLAQSWLFKGLMMILIVSFGIWGIGDIFRGNPLQRKVAKAGDEVVTVQQLDRAFQEKLGQIRRTMGTDMTAQEARQMGLLEQVLDELISRTVLYQGVERLGLDVSDKTVFDWLKTQQGFSNKDGSLDRNALQGLLQKLHLDEAHFLVDEKKSLAGREVADALDAVGKTPQIIVNPLVGAEGQKRILDVVTLMNNGQRDIPAPNENTLRDFYQKNPKLFVAPEYRGLTIAKLSTDEVKKDIHITEDQAKKEYDARSSQYAHPERRDVLQVVMQDEAKAKQLAAVGRSSGNLPLAAAGLGVKTVPLNGTEEKKLLPELAKPVFALQEGQVSDPVKTGLGWHVLQLKKIIPAGVPEFKDVKDQLMETMQRDQSVDVITRIVNQMDDDLAAGHPLEDIADATKLHLTKVPPLDAEGKTAEGVRAMPDMSFQGDLLEAGFNQNTGETSPIMDDKAGTYYIVRTDEIVPSAIQPFDKITDKVAAAWKAREQAKQAAAAAEAIAKGLRDGKSPSSFAAQDGVEIRVSKPISSLGDKDPGLPPAVMPQIMGMKKGDVTTFAEPDRQLVLRLAEIVEMNNPEDSTRASVGGAVDRQLPDELGNQYIKYLRTLYPVTIDQDVLDSMRQEGQQGG